VVGFIYGPYTDPDGKPQQGIATNGTLEAYRAAGRRIAGRA
jgi:hypothetical protein